MTIMYHINGFLFILSLVIFAGCGHDHDHAHSHGDPHDHDDEIMEVHLSQQQFDALEIEVDTLPQRSLSGYVEANGQLEVPPQNEAAVTSIIGATVTGIQVIEGDRVRAGQVLAYASHPDLIKLQTDFLTQESQIDYLQEEYDRQKKLYDAQVGAGKEYQKIRAELRTAQGMRDGYAGQLKLLSISVEEIVANGIVDKVPVKTPIAGHIRKVFIKTGQYVEPHTEMFDVVNNEHIHADLMVFEKDMHKVEKGQRVLFTLESIPGKELEATIYAVGKAFEQDPKAIHLHAEIENKAGLLIPGMYVRGRILTESERVHALPEAGIVREGDEHFMFEARQNGDTADEWVFTPVRIIAGKSDNGWVETRLLTPLDTGATVALNGAYYLMSELKKGEAGHGHTH